MCCRVKLLCVRLNMEELLNSTLVDYEYQEEVTGFGKFFALLTVNSAIIV